MRVPYTKVYPTDWLSWRRVIPAERLCLIMDAVADYCQFAQQTFKTENDAEQQVYDTLIQWAEEARTATGSAREKQRKSVESRLANKNSNLPSNLPSALQSESYTESELNTDININTTDIETEVTRARKISADKVIEMWNTVARKWKRPTLRTFPADLRRNFAARLKEEQVTPDEFFIICDDALAKDESMRNGTDTWPGADLDYFCRPKNFRRARAVAENPSLKSDNKADGIDALGRGMAMADKIIEALGQK